MKKTENKDKLYSERIQNLIKLVEEKISIKSYERRLTLKRFLIGVIPNMVVILIVIWLFSIVFQVASWYMTMAETKDVVLIMISIVALTITLISFISKLPSEFHSLFRELSKEEVANWNFKRLNERVEKEDIQLLKALIIMKCKHPDIDLKTIYKVNDTMFTEKRLLEMLYG